MRHWATPEANYYDRHEYSRKLKAAGFVNIQCRSISAHVFPGTVTYSALRRSGLRIEEAVIPELSAADVQKAMKRWSSLALTDYIIVSADKPLASDA